MRQLLIAIAVTMALFLGWLTWDGWFYLQRGYSIGVSIDGGASASYHIDFPPWRAAAHLLLSAAAMAAIAAYITSRRWASRAAWLTLVATLMVGIYDVRQYGTLGSPTVRRQRLWHRFEVVI